MNFTNTNEFFEEVATGNVAMIDIKRYINLITDNHNIEYLKSLNSDIKFFISIYNEDLIAEITDADWLEKIKYYEEKGENIPVIRNENMVRKLYEKKGLPFEHLPEFTVDYDVEKIFYPYELFSIRKLEFYIKSLIKDKETPQLKKQKPNKSLLFEGKDLNLLERYKLADKVLNIDSTIRKLKIQELEKYQLLAYILGCDKDNARNLMNGTYNAKDRDLSQYFNDLGLKI